MRQPRQSLAGRDGSKPAFANARHLRGAERPRPGDAGGGRRLGAWLAGDQAALAAPIETISGSLAAEVAKLVFQAPGGPVAAATSQPVEFIGFR